MSNTNTENAARAIATKILKRIHESPRLSHAWSEMPDQRQAELSETFRLIALTEIIAIGEQEEPSTRRESIAERCATEALSDLCGRGGFDSAWRACAHNTKNEIIGAITQRIARVLLEHPLTAHRVADELREDRDRDLGRRVGRITRVDHQTARLAASRYAVTPSVPRVVPHDDMQRVSAAYLELLWIVSLRARIDRDIDELPGISVRTPIANACEDCGSTDDRHPYGCRGLSPERYQPRP